MNATETPRRIWIGCLAAYNAGNLHGEWIDADEDLEAAKDRILAASPEPDAEEWFIADHEGFPAGAIGEYTPLEEVTELVEKIEEAERFVPADAVAAFIANVGVDYFDPTDCEDSYAGCWRDGEEYAAEQAESCYTEAELGPLAAYIDYSRMYRDMRLGGEVWEADAGDGEIYIFRSY